MNNQHGYAISVTPQTYYLVDVLTPRLTAELDHQIRANVEEMMDDYAEERGMTATYMHDERAENGHSFTYKVA